LQQRWAVHLLYIVVILPQGRGCNFWERVYSSIHL
jgi:hypothetical protein